MKRCGPTRDKRGRALQFETLERRIVLDSSVVFNELMYHPKGPDEEGLEWVELHSQMSIDIDLSDWRVSGGIDFKIPSGTVLPAGEYLVVAKDPAALTAATGGGFQIVGPFDGRLSNGGELVRLRDLNDRIMDEIDFRDAGDWPVAPDGSGVSLAKVIEELGSAPFDNWTFSTIVGGTPGRANSSDGISRTSPIALDANWKYHDAGIDLGTTWRNSGYDDSSWSEGTGLFFDNTGQLPVPGNTALNPGQDAYYFRTTFDFAGDPADVQLKLNSILDDGAVYYLNGQEVYRQNMPAGTITFATQALVPVGDATASGEIVVPSSALVAGTNVLAVEVHQAPASIASTVAYYRFEEGSGTSIVDDVTSSTHGNRIGGSYSTDVPTSSINATGESNNFSVDLVDARALITGEPFLFHDPSVGGAVGDATLEWFMKVPGATGHSSIFWTSATNEDTNRFNIFWNASFTGLPGSDQFVSGDFRQPDGDIADIGNHANGHVVLLNEWHHFAIVRADNSPTNQTDADFTWSWYIDGTLIPSLTMTTTASLPTQTSWLIAGRQGSSESGVDALFDEIRFSQGAVSPDNFLTGTGGVASEPDAAFGAAVHIEQETGVPELVINEVAAADSPPFFVELLNTGNSVVELGQMIVESSANPGGRYALPSQLLSPGAYALVTAADLGFTPAENDRLFLYAPGGGALIDAIKVEAEPRARLADGPRVQIPAASTPGFENSFALFDQIVINEIMYHHRVLDSGQVPQGSDEEWIELHNRSDQTIDLSGWRLDDAVDYVFPAGTILEPFEYLVVAKDAAALASEYPNVTILGDFSGRLSNSHERIQLRDAIGNIADEVHYFDDKPWPQRADGGGSSLELRDPDADNSTADAWAASDEADASTWQTYTYRGIAGPGDSLPTYHELVIGLLDAGEVLLDDITVHESPDGINRQLIQNSNFEGGTTSKWRIIGNHHGAVITDPVDTGNRILRLYSTGRTDDIHNHAETTLKSGSTFVSITPGTEYEISYRAKWIGGSNQLNTRLYFHEVQATTRIDVPQQSGTAGAQNSRFDNIGPTYDHFAHGPVVPEAGQSVTVSAFAEDPNGVAAVDLYWRVDGGAWRSEPMFLSGDLYTADIPGHVAGTKIQFYVEGTDGLGNRSTFPAAGRESGTYFVVEDSQADPKIGNLRVIMASSDINLQASSTQLMSNERLRTTVVVDESDVYYDVGVRYSGASSSRQGSNHGYNIRFDADKLFRGFHETITIDRNHDDEILIHHLMHQAGGLAAMENDLLHFIAPSSSKTGRAQIRMSAVRNPFVESQYPGDNGTLFEKELTYRQQLSNPGNRESLKTPFGYSHPIELNTDLEDFGDDQEQYRWHWLIKNNRDIDDYSTIIALNQAFELSGAALDEATRAVIDVDQWLRGFAAMRLFGNRDFYSQPSGGQGHWRHNFWVYVRESDSRAVLLPSDIDENYQIPIDSTIFGIGNVRDMILLPDNLHYYYGHLNDVMNQAFNTTYITPWANHFASLLPGISFSTGTSYIASRTAYVRSQLPAFEDFQITTAPPPVVDTPTVTIGGRGWVNVREIRIQGSAEPLDVTWVSPTEWTAVLPLSRGENVVTLESYDFQGKPISTPFDTTITVTSTAAGNPYDEFLQISEINYHPADPSSAELTAGFADDNDFEFIEFYNSSTSLTLDLTGVRITSGPNSPFDFTGSDVTSLVPGEYVLVVRNQAAFEFRNGTRFSDRIAGTYEGKLDNAGEQIIVVDPTGVEIHNFTYDDDPPWPVEADGAGFSLVLVDPPSNPDHGLVASWRASLQPGGSPARADLLPGDFDGDGFVDGDDFLVWQVGFGTDSGATIADGDADSDGDVDGDDFLIWQSNFANTGGNGATAGTTAPISPFLGPALNTNRDPGTTSLLPPPQRNDRSPKTRLEYTARDIALMMFEPTSHRSHLFRLRREHHAAKSGLGYDESLRNLEEGAMHWRSLQRLVELLRKWP